jgi:hypothetical protein
MDGREKSKIKWISKYSREKFGSLVLLHGKMAGELKQLPTAGKGKPYIWNKKNDKRYEGQKKSQINLSKEGGGK